MFAHEIGDEQWEMESSEYRRQEYEIESWLRSTDVETVHRVFEEVTGGSDEAIALYDRAFKAVMSGTTFDIKEEVQIAFMGDYKTWVKVAYK